MQFFLHFSKLDFGHSSYSRRLKIVLWFSSVYILTTMNSNICDREVFSNSPFFITADNAGAVEARFILYFNFSSHRYFYSKNPYLYFIALCGCRKTDEYKEITVPAGKTHEVYFSTFWVWLRVRYALNRVYDVILWFWLFCCDSVFGWERGHWFILWVGLVALLQNQKLPFSFPAPWHKIAKLIRPNTHFYDLLKDAKMKSAYW